jgi:hypothetical protein
MGEGFDNHLGVMQLNDQPVNWTSMDLSFLLQDNYQKLLYSWMDKAEVRWWFILWWWLGGRG